MSLQPNSFDSKFDAVAIRLPLIDKTVPKFGGTHPVVLFASQGKTPLDLPLGAGRNSPGDKAVGGAFESFSGIGMEQKLNFSPLPENYGINRVIFIIDCSSSMEWSLHSGSETKKINYVKERIESLAQNYFPETTNISLISFNSDYHVKTFEVRGNSTITQLKQAVKALDVGPGTIFNPPLEAARQIILDDHLKISNTQFDKSGAPRSVIVFLTDGQDRVIKGEDLPAATFTRLRDLNTTSFVLGIGQDYKMSRIIGLAGNAGASSWSHLPMENGTLDPFSTQLPSMLEQVMRCDKFFELQAKGDFGSFSCVTPTIRFASCYSPESVFPGYIREAVGVLYEKHDNLDLSLLAGRYCQDPDAERIEIPIIDVADAAHLFERAQEADEFDKAARALQAEDFSKRLVILTALMEQDLGLLKAIAEFDPSLREMVENLEGGLSGYKRDPSRGAHKFFSDMSEVGNTTRLDTSAINREDFQAYLDTKQANSKTIKGALDDRKHPNPVPKKGSEYPPVKDVLNAYFGRRASEQDRSSNEQHNTLEMNNLFSGHLGPLDEGSGTIHLPELPSKLDARVYDDLVTKNLFNVELLTSSGQSIQLHRLDKDHRYILGRKKEQPDGIPVVLNSESVSRRHAAIFIKDGEVHITDLGSLSGTLVGTVRVPTSGSIALRDGDILRLAKITLTLKLSKR